jgi:hypothetical protein
MMPVAVVVVVVVVVVVSVEFVASGSSITTPLRSIDIVVPIY